MAKNIFGSEQTYKGAFKADQATISLGGKSADGLLMQNIQFSFTQQVTVLYEIGSGNIYYVGGRAQGNMTVARIVGPAVGQWSFWQTFGDLCSSTNTMDFSAKGGCGGSQFQGQTYHMTGVVLTTLACSVAAQDIIVHEQLQFLFANLTVDSQGDSLPPDLQGE